MQRLNIGKSRPHRGWNIRINTAKKKANRQEDWQLRHGLDTDFNLVGHFADLAGSLLDYVTGHIERAAPPIQMELR